MGKQNQGFFHSPAFKLSQKVLYGLGASVVIVGAMFKINHWPGATAMLVLGLSVEALIFAVSVLVPDPLEFDWSLVYDEFNDENASSSRKEPGKGGPDVNEILKKAQIDDATLDQLGKGMRHLGDQASKLGDVADAAAATKDYGDAMLKASNRVNDLSNALDQNKQMFDGMSDLVSNLNDSVEETKQYKENIAQLSKNLAQLNTVYGNMLNAMGGGRS
jgi:gliding motility-associated protein GldL